MRRYGEEAGRGMAVVEEVEPSVERQRADGHRVRDEIVLRTLLKPSSRVQLCWSVLYPKATGHAHHRPSNPI